MSRIQNTFKQLAQQQRKALIPYVMAGYPQAETGLEILHALTAAGADIIELGIPFSDPMADGPVIQKAAETVLQAGMNLTKVLDLVAQFRQSNETTPIVLMGYANPIECYDLHHGKHAFVAAAAKAGVDGVLVVDYPPQECTEFKAQLQQHGLDLIFLLAPTSSEKRMAEVGALASGYVYYVSLKGVTGSSALDIAEVERTIPKIRQHVSTPIGVGFGIRDAASAKAVGAAADGVVIGSKIIQLLEQPDGVQKTAQFVQELRQALDSLK